MHQFSYETIIEFRTRFRELFIKQHNTLNTEYKDWRKNKYEDFLRNFETHLTSAINIQNSNNNDWKKLKKNIKRILSDAMIITLYKNEADNPEIYKVFVDSYIEQNKHSFEEIINDLILSKSILLNYSKNKEFINLFKGLGALIGSTFDYEEL